jgi:hypothetical protein
VIPLSAADPTSDIVKLILSYGITPITLITMAGFGLVYFKPAVDDLKANLAACREDLKETREDLRRQGDIMREILVPAVAKSSEMLQRVTDEIWRMRGAA